MCARVCVYLCAHAGDHRGAEVGPQQPHVIVKSRTRVLAWGDASSPPAICDLTDIEIVGTRAAVR